MVIKKQIVSIPMIPSRRSSRAGIGLEKPEEILRTIRRVSETLGVRRMKELYISQTGNSVTRWRTYVWLIAALIATAWGLLTLIITPLQMLLSIRLEMSPGLPPYDWWVRPPDEVLLKVYVFNITNPDRFINGDDKRLRLQEIGPIIYREKLLHLNPKHNPNGTLSYTANKTAIFLPEMNTIDLNDTITVPNLGVLLIPAYFHDSSMFLKFGVNMLLKSYNAKPLVQMSIQDYLWNATDPILIPAEKLAPTLVPTRNVGILNIIYKDFSNNVSVFIGNRHGNSKFFTIDTFDKSNYLPHFNNPEGCHLKFRNASEGVGYPQMITKDTNLTYWRKTVCKQADIRYARDDTKYGINAYRFELVSWAYNRTEWEGNEDCFAGEPAYPDGVADVSSCYWDFPIAASFPHYLHADERIGAHVEGFSPNEKDHGSYVLIEPITGIPLEGKARSQINLVLKKMTGFPRSIQAFSEKLVPLGWLEYHQVGVPWNIEWMIYMVAVVVPIAQLPLSFVSLVMGCGCFYFMIQSLIGSKLGSRERLVKSKVLKRESEGLMQYDCPK